MFKHWLVVDPDWRDAAETWPLNESASPSVLHLRKLLLEELQHLNVYVSTFGRIVLPWSCHPTVTFEVEDTGDPKLLPVTSGLSPRLEDP